MKRRTVGAALVAAAQIYAGTALAEWRDDGFRWRSETRDVMAEGAIWNDRIGDGKRSRLVRRHLIGNAVAQGQLTDALARVDILIGDNARIGFCQPLQ